MAASRREVGGPSSVDCLAAGSALARHLFADLAAATADPPGVTRVAYGDGERRAFAIVAEAGRAIGTEVAHDAAGNQFLTLPGGDRRRVLQIGSHLDSVPHGGNYDGAAGVIMGLALQAAIVTSGRALPFDLATVCLRAEESCWFPHSYIGSRTALGRLPPEALDTVRRADTARSLAEHMAGEGFDPEAVRRGEVLYRPDRILAHIEPHIEQGPVLQAEAVPIGLVTGIRGSFRYRELRCVGSYTHSGATPRAMRTDAVLAGADLVVAMQALWETLEIQGHDLAVTFGQFGTRVGSHSFSKVAGEVDLCLDVRSQSRETLSLVDEQLKSLIWEIAHRRGVRFVLGPRTDSEPALMTPRLVDLLGGAAHAAHVPTRLMASGAGHDAAIYAEAGVPTVMLFIRNQHGSHNPHEHMEMDDFDAALAVLWALAQRAPSELQALRQTAI